MRALSVILQQNLGTGSTATPATLDISAHLIDVGSINYEVDKELTKLTPGDVTLQVEDHDGAIWLWINTQIQMSGALWPPIVTLDVGGVRRFCGNIDPSAMTCDARTRQITLTCQDWSNQLANKNIEGWTRPLPKALKDRPEVTVENSNWTAGLALLSPPRLDTALFPEPFNSFIEGDMVNIVTPNGTFTSVKVLSVTTEIATVPTASRTVRFGQAIWPSYWPYHSGHDAEYIGQFTRLASSLDSIEFFQVKTAVTGDAADGFDIVLDTVDGIVAGDRMELLATSSTRTWTVSIVNSANNTLTMLEAVGELALNDRIYWTDECAAEVVMVDSILALQNAAFPFIVNTTRLVMPTFASPLFSYIPTRMSGSGDLTSVCSVIPTITDLAVYASFLPVVAWHGSPEGGWLPTNDLPALMVGWANQLNSAPSELMEVLPYSYASEVFAYDYLNNRVVIFNTTSSDGSIRGWSGATWLSPTTFSWMHGIVGAACVFPGHSGAILATTATHLWYAELPSGASTSFALTSTIAGRDPSTGVLGSADVVCTPWGAYLVSSKGYGKITYSGGSLYVEWVSVFPLGSVAVPWTFCHIDSERLFVLCKYYDTISEASKTVTTHGVMLTANPNSADAKAAVLWDDKICDGEPGWNCGAIHDPFFAGERVIGWMAGKLFQVSDSLSTGYAIERFNPSKFTAMELIEHICQVLRAVAVAAPDNVLHIISRSDTLDIIELVVDRVEVVETRAWENFFSTVLVTGGADSTGEAAGPNVGGQLLEITGHPLVWTSSMCSAMASSYAEWFGTPRRVSAETWFWSHPETAAPWEGLPPLARVRVNGGTTAYIVMGVQDLGHARAGSAQVILLEVV